MYFYRSLPRSFWFSGEHIVTQGSLRVRWFFKKVTWVVSEMERVKGQVVILRKGSKYFHWKGEIWIKTWGRWGSEPWRPPKGIVFYAAGEARTKPKEALYLTSLKKGKGTTWLEWRQLGRARVSGWVEGYCRVLQVILRAWVFLLSEMGNHWKVTWYDLILWKDHSGYCVKIDFAGGANVEIWRPSPWLFQ